MHHCHCHCCFDYVVVKARPVQATLVLCRLQADFTRQAVTAFNRKLAVNSISVSNLGYLLSCQGCTLACFSWDLKLSNVSILCARVLCDGESWTRSRMNNVLFCSQGCSVRMDMNNSTNYCICVNSHGQFRTGVTPGIARQSNMWRQQAEAGGKLHTSRSGSSSPGQSTNA